MRKILLRNYAEEYVAEWIAIGIQGIEEDPPPGTAYVEGNTFYFDEDMETRDAVLHQLDLAADTGLGDEEDEDLSIVKVTKALMYLMGKVG